VLADCKEEERMREVLAQHRPAVIFHAAAYKHVAMMETNPVEAIRNNSLATRVIARAAGDLGVETFVLISTDKAVAPATVMGASKALAEWAVEAEAATHPKTSYATVRFGNVLGSSGSVVPIFRRQIETGGPVTVTDPRMTRYFMTIPEAVQLVIRSGSLVDTSGEVFVLEMGEPIRIIDLAEQMIRLSGFEPETDIAIEIVGQRPGEKFHEDLFNPYERPRQTPAQKILRADREPIDPTWVRSIFDRMNLLVLEGDRDALTEHVSKLDAARPYHTVGGTSPATPGAAPGPRARVSP
jgi:FlaA1/EpsC-like NDP-sugar epimerase